MGSTNTGLTVLNRLVGDREFTQIVTNHFRLNFHSVELLAVVHTDNAADHLGNDDHVPEVSLYNGGLLVGRSLLFLSYKRKGGGSRMKVFSKRAERT